MWGSSSGKSRKIVPRVFSLFAIFAASSCARWRLFLCLSSVPTFRWWENERKNYQRYRQLPGSVDLRTRWAVVSTFCSSFLCYYGNMTLMTLEKLVRTPVMTANATRRLNHLAATLPHFYWKYASGICKDIRTLAYSSLGAENHLK